MKTNKRSSMLPNVDFRVNYNWGAIIQAILITKFINILFIFFYKKILSFKYWIRLEKLLFS